MINSKKQSIKTTSSSYSSPQDNINSNSCFIRQTPELIPQKQSKQQIFENHKNLKPKTPPIPSDIQTINIRGSQLASFEFTQNIKLIDLNIRHHSLQKAQIKKSYVSPDFVQTQYIVYISHFAIPVRIKNNFNKQYEFRQKYEFSKGAFGKCYQVEMQDEIYCVKKIEFQNPSFVLYQNQNLIKEIGICKLASHLNIGPKFKSFKANNEPPNPPRPPKTFKNQQQKVQFVPNIKQRNLFQYHDVLMYQSCAIFAMELCIPFNKIIEDRKMRPGLIFNMSQNISECIKTLHSLNIVHRDIKPDNIVFSQTINKFILCDFGLSHPVRVQKTYVKRFKGTLDFAVPQLQKLYQQKRPCYINLYQNDYYALSRTINICKIMINEIMKNKRGFQQIRTDTVLNNISSLIIQKPLSSQKALLARLELMKRVFGFNHQIETLWRQIIQNHQPQQPQYEPLSLNNVYYNSKKDVMNQIFIKNSPQSEIFKQSSIRTYKKKYNKMCFDEYSVNNIIDVFRSQGYVKESLFKLLSCLQELRYIKNKSNNRNINLLFMYFLQFNQLDQQQIKLRLEIFCIKNRFYKKDEQFLKQFQNIVKMNNYNDSLLIQNLIIKISQNQYKTWSQVSQFLNKIQKNLSQLIDTNDRDMKMKKLETLLIFIMQFQDSKSKALLLKIQREVLRIVLKIRRRNKMIFDNHLLSLYTKVSKRQENLRSINCAQVILDHILQKNQRTQQSILLTAEIYHAKSFYYYKTMNWNLCKYNSEKALKIYECHFNQNSYSYALSLNNYSHSLQNTKGREKQNFNKIIKYRERSCYLRQLHLGKNTLKFCLCMFDLIVIYEYQQRSSDLQTLYSGLADVLRYLRNDIYSRPLRNVSRLVRFYFKAVVGLDEYADWKFTNPVRVYSLAAFYIYSIGFKDQRQNSKFNDKQSSMTQKERINMLCRIRITKFTHKIKPLDKLLFYLLFKIDKSSKQMQFFKNKYQSTFKIWQKNTVKSDIFRTEYHIDQILGLNSSGFSTLMCQ